MPNNKVLSEFQAALATGSSKTSDSQAGGSGASTDKPVEASGGGGAPVVANSPIVSSRSTLFGSGMRHRKPQEDTWEAREMELRGSTHR